MRNIATVSAFFACLAIAFVPAAGHAFDRTPTGAVIAAGPFAPTFEAIQANVFTPSCALSFCHGAAMQANMDLRVGAAYNSIVGVTSVEVPPKKRIDPFLPDDSYLICKLENCSWILGQQMPLIGGPLDQSMIDVIRTWVLSGAPEFPDVAVEPSSWGRMKAEYR